MEVLRRVHLILVPNAGIYRDKKSDRVRQQRRNNAIQSLGNNDNIRGYTAVSESARDSSYATHVESLFRKIVYLLCCAVRAAKIFGR